MTILAKFEAIGGCRQRRRGRDYAFFFSAGKPCKSASLDFVPSQGPNVDFIKAGMVGAGVDNDLDALAFDETGPLDEPRLLAVRWRMTVALAPERGLLDFAGIEAVVTDRQASVKEGDHEALAAGDAPAVGGIHHRAGRIAIMITQRTRAARPSEIGLLVFMLDGVFG